MQKRGLVRGKLGLRRPTRWEKAQEQHKRVFEFYKDQATKLLVHYFQLMFEKAGVPFERDNDAEIRDIVNNLLRAAKEQNYIR